MPTRHDRRSQQRTLLTTRDSRTNKQDTFGGQRLAAANRVREVTVATIDHNIALFQIRQQLLDEVIHRLPGLHHQHYTTRTLQACNQLLHRMRANEVLAFASAIQERINLVDRAVETRNRESLALGIQHQVLAHDGKPYQTQISFLTHQYSP